MVLGILLGDLALFTFIAIASYAGTLRALEVYQDPTASSDLLSDDH